MQFDNFSLKVKVRLSFGNKAVISSISKLIIKKWGEGARKLGEFKKDGWKLILFFFLFKFLLFDLFFKSNLIVKGRSHH